MSADNTLPEDGGKELPFEVRDSKVHGLGVFAVRPIRKGRRLTEYLGERVSHKEADRRYESKDANDNHTFLFTVDRKTVIDAAVGGNEARYFNHSCDPNCESLIENRRVFIEAIRDVRPGEELTYDYQIGREADDPPNIDEIFACRCGAPQCRGTMLWPPKRPARRKSARKKVAGKQTKGKQATRSQGKSGAGRAKRAPAQAGSKAKSGSRAATRGRSRSPAKSKAPARVRNNVPARAKGKAVAKKAPSRAKGGSNGRSKARAKSKR